MPLFFGDENDDFPAGIGINEQTLLRETRERCIAATHVDRRQDEGNAARTDVKHHAAPPQATSICMASSSGDFVSKLISVPLGSFMRKSRLSPSAA